jgi:hypothetical protein
MTCEFNQLFLGRCLPSLLPKPFYVSVIPLLITEPADFLLMSHTGLILAITGKEI